MRLRVVGLVAVMAMVLASCGGGAPEAAGPSEGIQVHGDWTIDIYDEDGSLDRHVEFSNALTPPGEDLLLELLAAERTTGPWQIWIADTNSGPCQTTQPSDGHCRIDATTVVENDRLTLTGSIVVENDADVTLVRTIVSRCTQNTTPADCLSLGMQTSTEFTRTTIPAEPVTAGQSVQVQVAISFTSG